MATADFHMANQSFPRRGVLIAGADEILRHDFADQPLADDME